MGNGPTQSIRIRSKGSPKTGMGFNGGWRNHLIWFARYLARMAGLTKFGYIWLHGRPKEMLHQMIMKFYECQHGRKLMIMRNTQYLLSVRFRDNNLENSAPVILGMTWRPLTHQYILLKVVCHWMLWQISQLNSGFNTVGPHLSI